MTDPAVPGEPGASSAPPPPPEEPAARRGVAILLAGAALVAAVIGGRVAFRSFTATSLWQQSVREETKRAAAYVETLRYVYTSEQPLAFALSEARFRSEELAKLAPTLSGTDRSAVELEQVVQEYLSSGQLAEASPLFNDAKYRSDQGFDITRRLADQLNENPDLLAIDPERTRASGNKASTHAIRLMATTIIVALAFMFGTLAQGFDRRRQVFLSIGTVLLVIGTASAAVVEVVS
jgi:hypothetical protein